MKSSDSICGSDQPNVKEELCVDEHTKIGQVSYDKAEDNDDNDDKQNGSDHSITGSIQ